MTRRMVQRGRFNAERDHDLPEDWQEQAQDATRQLLDATLKMMERRNARS
jgi:hypothetical protein